MSLTFDIHLAALTPLEFDVVMRQIEIVIRDEPPVDMDVPAEQLIVGPHFGNHGDTLRIKCWNVNAAGNESLVPSVLETVLRDPFYPPTPGQPSIVVTGKTHAPNAAYHVQINEPLVVSAEDGPLRAVVQVSQEPKP